MYIQNKNITNISIIVKPFHIHVDKKFIKRVFSMFLRVHFLFILRQSCQHIVSPLPAFLKFL